MVIAADGGARHCLRLGIVPNVVIGDFDLLTESEISTLDSAKVKLIRFPIEKDQTDLELALDYALETGANTVTLYGLLGGRWDMTFANLLLLASPKYTGNRFHIIDGETMGTLLYGTETQNLGGQPGDLVSVIPLNGPAKGITYKGLQWPLENANLPFGTPQGVSNFIVSADAQISLESGTLLVFIISSEAK